MSRNFANILLGACLVLMVVNTIRSDWFGFFLILVTAASLIATMSNRAS